jgi:hypothetical protein
MANIRTTGNVSGKATQIKDTDIGLLGGIDTASGNLTIKGGGNLAFTITGTNGNISFNNIVITNIAFDNLTHTISASTQTATNAGPGLIILSGSGGVASGATAGGIGGTTLVLSGTGGNAAAGAGAGGAGGDVDVTAANGGTGTATGVGGDGGNVSIFAGNAGTNNGAGGGNGGDLTGDAGVATGAGTNGIINIGTAIASAMTIANGSIPVTANGIWTFTNAIIGTISNSNTVQSTSTFTCPSGVAVRDTVYLTGSLAVDQADASVIATVPVIGFVKTKPTATTCTLQYYGELSGFTGLTPAAKYYLSLTAGGITTTAPSASGEIVQQVGIAISSTILLVKIDNFFTEL